MESWLGLESFSVYLRKIDSTDDLLLYWSFHYGYSLLPILLTYLSQTVNKCYHIIRGLLNPLSL